MWPTFDLGHVNDLNDDVVVEVDVEEALKSSIFIVQKAAAPKSGVEFRQDSIGDNADEAAHTQKRHISKFQFNHIFWIVVTIEMSQAKIKNQNQVPRLLLQYRLVGIAD